MTKQRIILALLSVALSTPLSAGNLRFESLNPSFGGNPNLNGFLVGTAQIQNQFLESGGGGNEVPDIEFPPIVIDLGGLGGDVTEPVAGELPTQ